MSWRSLTPGTGYALLEVVYDSSSPGWLREIPAADVLRRVLVQNCTRIITEDGREVIRRREKEPEGDGLPHPAHQGEAPAGALAWVTGRLARLTAPSQTGPDGDRYCPEPAPEWWKLAADGRREPIARLRGWVEQVYRPGYGHLAAGLGPCWPAHDLCLYALDIASELWSVLYLQSARSPALLSAQAEYQARILPALADQLRIETNTCGHPRHPTPAPGQPWTRP